MQKKAFLACFVSFLGNALLTCWAFFARFVVFVLVKEREMLAFGVVGFDIYDFLYFMCIFCILCAFFSEYIFL